MKQKAENMLAQFIYRQINKSWLASGRYANKVARINQIKHSAGHCNLIIGNWTDGCMDGQFVRLTCSGDIGMASVHHGPVSECVCVCIQSDHWANTKHSALVSVINKRGSSGQVTPNCFKWSSRLVHTHTHTHASALESHYSQWHSLTACHSLETFWISWNHFFLANSVPEKICSSVDYGAWSNWHVLTRSSSLAWPHCWIDAFCFRISSFAWSCGHWAMLLVVSIFNRAQCAQW